MNRGPCIQVNLSIASPIAEQLLQKGESLPAPVSGLALIDTGASVTCIDETAAAKLGLPPVDVVSIASASSASSQCNTYPVRIDLQGLPIGIDATKAIGAPLAAQGLVALIGRDVLSHFTLFYNGTTGQITLAM